ncbi:DUF4139 domain-containing protein [Streptomyces sp. NPDC006334]|uniref:DUF4139 domain-containing protein n=1 Tax=Streptomyces sp. NPDC006334 TaxID=3156754 RepID=UPI0033A6D9EF
MRAEQARSWGSTLDSVVVYAQGALCRRLARGRVPADGRVRVKGLPRSLDPGSLRAAVLGGTGVRVVEARVEIDAEPADADTRDRLRREVDELRDAYAAAQARRDRQLRRIEEVQALHPVAPPRKRDDPHRRTPVDAWLELGDFVEQRLTALHAGLVEFEEAVQRAEHELAVAVDRLARASTDAPPAHVASTVCAVLTLDGAGEGDDEVDVEVEYGVPGAVWAPAYRLTHRQGEDSGRLMLRASVAQRTGEDWTGVLVSLSTADLRRRTDLPRLRSIRIGRRQPAPAPSGWREPPAGLADLFTGYDAAGPGPVTRDAPPALAVGGTGPRGVPVGGDAFPGYADFDEPLLAADPSLSAPPPAPAVYGGPPPMMPAPPGSAGPMAAPSAAFGEMQRSTPARPGRARTAGRPPVGGAPPSAPAPKVPQRPPAAGPPQPSSAELDYAGLVLSGPDDLADRRGRLFPDAPFDPVATEFRRRAEAVAALPLPGHAVRPRESAGSFDHRFDAAARADIPSDGVWHTVAVGEIPVGLRTEYLCVPSVEPTVYATLVLSNATGQALLAGPVEVTVDDDFLLTAALPTLAPGGVRRVGLGPAEGVRVTRRTTLNESTSGLRNNVTVLDHRVHVELANRLARPVTVEVREPVPVASDSDVRIEERADWTTPDDATGPDRHAPGTRVWRVTLPVGGVTALDGGYEIRFPAGKALVGGNRRS